MVVVKRFVCLANSRKPGGRCVAGIELAEDKKLGWIRPTRQGGLRDWDCRYPDGTALSARDLVAVSLVGPQPTGFQQENWLVSAALDWCKLGKVEWPDLVQLVDPIEPLWIDDFHTRHGQHDRIPTTMSQRLESSLRLIHVDRLKLRVSQPGKDYGDRKKKLQAGFAHAGKYYWLSVTDPAYEHEFLALTNGEYPLGESCLTVSMGEPHTDGFCYKLVAAIMERERT